MPRNPFGFRDLLTIGLFRFGMQFSRPKRDLPASCLRATNDPSDDIFSFKLPAAGLSNNILD